VDVPVEQYAYIWFAPNDKGLDFDPVAVTTALGLQPTEAHRAGEARANGRAWRRSAWHFGGEKSPELDWDVLVAPLLDALRAREAEVDRLRTEMGLVGGLQIVTEMSAEKTYVADDFDRDVWGVPTPGSGLSADHIQDLARLKLSFDADMYVYLSESMENAE
jgi:Domain of unknown function (DUF4279)